MEKDIVPEILENILNEFDESLKNNSELKKAFEILASKKANYKNANDFAVEVGNILSDCFKNSISKDILPDGKMYFNIADRLLNPTLNKANGVISNYSTEVQTVLNKASNLNVKGISADVNQDKINGFINKISKSDDFEKVEWLLDEPIKNFCISIVDDTIKINVEHHHKLGLNPVVRRISSGKCCKWCDKLAGIYNYPNVPKDVYRRHRHCDCIVDYYPGDGRKQNVWSKQWKDVDKSDIIEKRKLIGLKKDIDKVKVSLQVQLNFLDNITNEKSFIPKNTIITDCKTIAEGKEIRVVTKLIDKFGGRITNWKKRVGKVESAKYIHDVHWYENKNRQYLTKIKFRKEKL